MPRFNRPTLQRIALFSVFAVLAVIAHRQQRSVPHLAHAEQIDPKLFWQIGTPDHSSDEFGLGSAKQLSYVVGTNNPRDWRARQESGDGSVYEIKFSLPD